MRKNGSHKKGQLYHCKIACDPIQSTKHQERQRQLRQQILNLNTLEIFLKVKKRVRHNEGEKDNE